MATIRQNKHENNGQTFSKGILKTWKDDRGFGFIQPEHGDKDIFLHISSLNGMPRRPNRGDVIFYEIAKDNRGKFKAVNARIEGLEIQNKATSSNKRLLWWVSALAVLVVSGIVAVYWK